MVKLVVPTKAERPQVSDCGRESDFSCLDYDCKLYVLVLFIPVLG